jgi:hypothetical protein
MREGALVWRLIELDPDHAYALHEAAYFARVHWGWICRYEDWLTGVAR